MPDEIPHFTMLTFIMLLSQHTCHSYMTGIMLHIFLYFQLHYGTDAVRDDAYAAGFLFSECAVKAALGRRIGILLFSE
jgi:hypothetical protein